MNKEKKIAVLAVVILIAFSLIAATYFLVYYEGTDNSNSDEDNALGYKTVSISEAYDLINQSDNNEIDLIIVDCRGFDSHVSCSDCTFKAGHIPGAERSINPNAYADTTYDILVYGANKNESEKFCIELANDVENVAGSIYNLDGSWDDWRYHHTVYGWPPIKTGLNP